MRKTRVQLYCCVSVQSAAKRSPSPLEEEQVTITHFGVALGKLIFFLYILQLRKKSFFFFLYNFPAKLSMFLILIWHPSFSPACPHIQSPPACVQGVYMLKNTPHTWVSSSECLARSSSHWAQGSSALKQQHTGHWAQGQHGALACSCVELPLLPALSLDLPQLSLAFKYWKYLLRVDLANPSKRQPLGGPECMPRQRGWEEDSSSLASADKEDWSLTGDAEGSGILVSLASEASHFEQNKRMVGHHFHR